ncbi:MAG: hypothetical protein EYC70_07005 [Planctomycetota bacterium]|nr:MAG: hypothetical protein EYC70_07005 [Planctomycetota bacterium]
MQAPGVWRFELPLGGTFALESADQEWCVGTSEAVEVLEGQETVVWVDLVPSTALRVRVVSEPGDKALEGMRVHLSRSAWNPMTEAPSRGAHVATEVTGPDGVAVFDGVAADVALDILAGGRLEYEAVEVRGVLASANEVTLRLRKAWIRPLHVLDLTTGLPVPRAYVYANNTRVHEAIGCSLPAGASPAARVECFGYASIEGQTDEQGQVLLLDWEHANLVVIADGYARKRQVLRRSDPDWTVWLAPYGVIGGRVSDRTGAPVANASIQYIVDPVVEGLQPIEGTAQSDGMGLYRVELPDAVVEGIAGQCRATVRLAAEHPQAGRAEYYGFVPAAEECASELDVVLVPERELRIHVLPGAEWPAGAVVYGAFASSGLLDAHFMPDYGSRYRRVVLDADGTGIMEGVPLEGQGWFAVVSGENGKVLALCGPLDLADLDTEWSIRLPAAQELGALRLTVATPGSHVLTLQPYQGPTTGNRDPLAGVSVMRLRVEGQRDVTVENLLPGYYRARVDDAALESAAGIRGGLATDLGVIAIPSR